MIKNYLKYCSNLDDEAHCGSVVMNIGLVRRKTQLYNICIIFMEDKYEELSDEELKEIFEDMEADYWIDQSGSW